MMRWFMALGAALCVALASHATAYGVTINVDFNGAAGSGTFAAVGAAPDPGTVWNGVSPPDSPFTSGSLVDSNGLPTAVTVSFELYREYAANENAAAFAGALLTDFVYQPGPAGVGPSVPPPNFSINNLTPGGVYDLYFYSQNGGYSNTATSFTIGATTKIATNIPGGGGPGSFIENTNYVVFSGVVATGGVIVGEFNDVPLDNNAAFNGMQIVQTAIPEPASIVTALLGCGALLAGRMLRRRARSAERQSA